MEAQATPGNPREERGCSQDWEGCPGGEAHPRQWEQRPEAEQDVSGLHTQTPPSGEASQGCGRLEHQVGLGVFLDKALEFCWIHGEFGGTGSACTPLLASGEQTFSFRQKC